MISAFLLGISTAMQKYSMSKMKNFSFKNLMKSNIWIGSLAITIVAGILYIISLQKINLGLSQIIFSSSFLVPVLIGAFVFREKMGIKKWIAVTSIIIGIILVML